MSEDVPHRDEHSMLWYKSLWRTFELTPEDQYPFLGEDSTQERRTPGADRLEQHTEPSWYSVESYYKNACTTYPSVYELWL